MKKSKRVKKSNLWKIKQNRDQFIKKSKTLGYRSRASFKLIELNKKFQFFKKDTRLLDLGSCPGGWSQVASEIITKGKILSIDIKPMKPIKNVKFINRNVFDLISNNEISNYFNGNIDVVISDMAADTTGNKSLDCIRTNQLCMEALNYSAKILHNNGVFVSKLFMGEDFIEVKNLAKLVFKKVNFFKPDSSRNESKETYLHCKVLNTL